MPECNTTENGTPATTQGLCPQLLPPRLSQEVAIYICFLFRTGEAVTLQHSIAVLSNRQLHPCVQN
jgi:hypothetical protein